MLKEAIIAAVALLFCGEAGHAQTNRQCESSVDLRVSAEEARQGSLVTVELEGANAMADVKGKWDGHEVPFWKDTTSGQEHWRALLGVDLEQGAGKYELQVNGKFADGTALHCSVALSVAAGHFATEKLHVGKQFVEPNPEQLERAKAETARLREIFATVTPQKLWSGEFRVPLDGVHKGGNFGRRRVLNGQPGSPHSGVDFPAPAGTAVHATQSGRVVLAEELYFSGNTVLLDHGLGVYTLYGHLSAMDVKAGDSVEAGAVLGKVGATGRSTGPHLHWGLTVGRARVNALEIVKLRH